MTNDELQEHIRAIEEAVARGEVEQSFEGGSWRRIDDDECVCVNDLDYAYRIKPKEMSLARIPNPYDGSADCWMDCTGQEGGWMGVIRVREVIE